MDLKLCEKKRVVLRGIITRTLDDAYTAYNANATEDFAVKVGYLQVKGSELYTLDQKIADLKLEACSEEDLIADEMQSQSYQEKLIKITTLLTNTQNNPGGIRSSNTSEKSASASDQTKSSGSGSNMSPGIIQGQQPTGEQPKFSSQKSSDSLLNDEMQKLCVSESPRLGPPQDHCQRKRDKAPKHYRNSSSGSSAHSHPKSNEGIVPPNTSNKPEKELVPPRLGHSDQNLGTSPRNSGGRYPKPLPAASLPDLSNNAKASPLSPVANMELEPKASETAATKSVKFPHKSPASSKTTGARRPHPGNNWRQGNRRPYQGSCQPARSEFRLILPQDMGLFLYLVKLDPQVKDAKQRCTILEKNLPIKRAIFCGECPDIMFLTERLPSDEMKLDCHPVGESPVEVTVTFKRKLPVDQLTQLVGTLIRARVKELIKATPKILPKHALKIWPATETVTDVVGEWGLSLPANLVDYVMEKPRENILSWLLIFRRNDGDLASYLAEGMFCVGEVYRICIGKPSFVELPDEGCEAFIRALQSQIRPETQVVVAIIGDDQDGSYDAVRKFYSHDQPVPGQIVKASTLKKAMEKRTGTVRTIVDQIESKLARSLCSSLKSLKAPAPV